MSPNQASESRPSTSDENNNRAPHVYKPSIRRSLANASSNIVDATKNLFHAANKLPKKAKLAGAAVVISAAAGTAGVEPFKTIDQAVVAIPGAIADVIGEYPRQVDKLIEERAKIPPAQYASDGTIFLKGSYVDQYSLESLGDTKVIPGAEGYIVNFPALNLVTKDGPEMVVPAVDKDGNKRFVTFLAPSPLDEVGTGVGGNAIIVKKATEIGEINVDGTVKAPDAPTFIFPKAEKLSQVTLAKAPPTPQP
jgi:hypothetical protein